MFMRKAVAIVATAAILTACGSNTPSQSSAAGGAASAAAPAASAAAAPATSCDKPNYVPYVFHVPPSIPFIAVFKKGVDQAAKDYSGPPYCITTEFLAPDKFDTAQQAQILDAALAKSPVALALAFPDKSALGPGLKRALDSGIPVITVNAGEEDALAAGVLTHVAEDETSVSFNHGARFAAAGAKSVMCVNDNPGTNVLTLRCDNIKKAMEAGGGTSFELPASNADPLQMKNALIAGLTSHPDVDAIGGVYSGDYQIALQAIDAVGKTGKIMVGVFDWQPGTQVLDDIKAGKVLFASSQGPFLQGYLPIQLLALQLIYKQIPNTHQLTNSGGVFADKTNADQYLELAASGF